MIPCCVMVMENESDRDFMARIYEEYSRLMYHEIFQILKNSWQTEDVVHSSVVRLIEKVDELRAKDRDHLVNYIISTCKNQAKNFIRDNARHNGYSFDDCFDVPDLERSRESMEDRLIHVEDLRRLPVAWGELDDRSRHVLEGYYILNKPMAELAEELNIKPGSVRMALTRARNNAFMLMQDDDN